METLNIGIDIAKATVEVAAWLAPRGYKVGRFPNTAPGHERLGERLAALAERQAAAQVQVTLEPSGGYELALAHWLHAHGYRVLLPNPASVRHFAHASGRRAKTDPQDALLLAQFGAAHPSAAAWQPLPPHVATLEALLQRQAAVEDLLQQEHNRQGALAAQPHLPDVVRQSVSQVIAALTSELASLGTAIRDHLAAHADLSDDLALLRSVPGVGARTAPWLLVLLRRWALLTEDAGTAKGLTAYVGLDPKPYESGSSVRRHAGISRQGSATMRRTLYLAAFGGVRHDNALRAFYLRLRGRQKPAKVARVACARKLLVCSWAVYRSHMPFDPSRAGTRQTTQPREEVLLTA